MANTETFIKELLDDILTYMDHLIDEREEIGAYSTFCSTLKNY